MDHCKKKCEVVPVHKHTDEGEYREWR